MPKVSIIITSYNCEKYIERTILSVTSQSERDVEILIIDDASTDGTLHIGLEAAKKDDRIRVYSQPHGGRPSITRNVGLNLAKGQYICFLDGDDLYDRRKIKSQCEFLDKNLNLDVIFHDLYLIDEFDSITHQSFLQKYKFLEKAKRYLTQISDEAYVCNEEFYIYMALHHSSVHTSSIMVRRSLVEREHIRFSEDVKMAEDIEFWWAVAEGRKLGYINRQLSSYRIHGSNITKNSERLYIDTIEVHSRNFNKCKSELTKTEKNQYIKKIAENWFLLGYFFFCNARIVDARKYYIVAMRQSFHIKFLNAYLKTFVPVKVRTFVQRKSGAFRS